MHFHISCGTIRKPTLPSFRKTEHFLIKDAKILDLNVHGLDHLKWWLGAIPNAKDRINTPQIDFEINTDASKTEWGAMDGSNFT